MLAFGTVNGGAIASLTGDKFWEGAVTGLVVSGLNHVAPRCRANPFAWLKAVLVPQ